MTPLNKTATIGILLEIVAWHFFHIPTACCGETELLTLGPLLLHKHSSNCVQHTLLHFDFDLSEQHQMILDLPCHFDNITCLQLGNFTDLNGNLRLLISRSCSIKLDWMLNSFVGRVNIFSMLYSSKIVGSLKNI